MQDVGIICYAEVQFYFSYAPTLHLAKTDGTKSQSHFNGVIILKYLVHQDIYCCSKEI